MYKWGSVWIGNMIILSEWLWKVKCSILCDVIFLVRLQEKFDIEHSGEWRVKTKTCRTIYSPWGVAAVRQSHVACPEVKHGPQYVQAAVYRVAPFDPDKRADLSLLERLFDLLGSGDKRERLRVDLRQAMDDVNLIDSVPHRILVLEIARDVRGPELGRAHTQTQTHKKSSKTFTIWADSVSSCLCGAIG